MRTGLVLVVLAATATSAHAGPFGQFGIGYLIPEGEDTPDTDYLDIVDGGLHLSLNLGWLFPIHGDGDTRVSIGPVAAAELTSYGVKDESAVGGISRWRFLGGARVALSTPRFQGSLQGLAGVDRPTYDWLELVEAFCGDTDTTSGFGWEVNASAGAAFGPVVIGASVGVLHADHSDDQPSCRGGIVVDVVDYISWDLVLQGTAGVSF